MEYFKINNNDYSLYVNELKINKEANYNVQTNAAGDTVADYINHKKSIEVGIIPLDNGTMVKLQNDIDNFYCSVSFLNPTTGTIETINCILPSNAVEYYTIQINKVMYKAFTLNFIEL